MSLDPQADRERFDRAVEFAKKEGYPVEFVGAGYYVTWQFTDRDRALLTLIGKELMNTRGIRIPIPDRITT